MSMSSRIAGPAKSGMLINCATRASWQGAREWFACLALEASVMVWSVAWVRGWLAIA